MLGQTDMAEHTFFWHDYETFGIDPLRDRPAQFAGLRTDSHLQPVGEPVNVLCKPAPDVLPHPDACLITGITPQQTEREGLIEPEFAAIVQSELGRPGTCGVGWNSLRFDDAFTRNLLYRNFYDPYAREWRNGNSRWDLIDLARMTYALRPAGMTWPLRDDGAPSFKLEHLANANGVVPRHAHDALSDVESLLAIACKLRAAQPRLWDWYYRLRRKNEVFGLLDTAHMKPLVHVSQRYPARRGCLAIIAPLAVHPSQPNAVIVADLGLDPTSWMHRSPEELAERLYTPRTDLPEDIERAPLKLLRANASPALAPLSVLKGVDLKRIELNLQENLDHLEQLRHCEGLAERVRTLYGNDARPIAADPELALYAAMPNDADRAVMSKVRTSPPAQLAELAHAFRDPRYTELLFRYRARYWPATLDASEQACWQQFRSDRLTRETSLTTLTVEAGLTRISELRIQPGLALTATPVLDQLEDWIRNLACGLGDIPPI